jgi:integrating conjugative element membrane protein (TIGR03747 family)
MAERNDSRGLREKPKNLAGKLIYGVFLIIGLLLLSLLVSILLEWAGIAFSFWDKPGTDHSREMLLTEVSYLETDFKRRLFNSSPAEMSVRVVEWTYAWLVVRSGFISLRAWLTQPVLETESSLVSFLKKFYTSVETYLLAAINIIQLFAVRLLVVTFSLLTYMVFGWAALVDGLVQRDLRRFGGGREYGLVYHRFKGWMKQLIFLPPLLYLALPIPIHPNSVFVPAAVLFGLTIFITASTFKKYL